ncbi:glycosyltransferase family 9 protein [Sulfurisoma sediminicola]|uniref:ADP-heptose:LPS heptosyltransferase n=1 Tax=Sulfurisoma sediminicola TaxID=1381557 RepID=A0A497XK31_9PROT|nr:glycosyltransferase family 9 protein [Sulfurisoma sediminicola]RLJ68312.1 ADP-heptose:LPS heptosyltransferase [Sulfurisoma sediminicola]
MTPALRRILVVRRDNIGDLVCTTPLIDALRAALPDAHIAALVNSYNAEVLARNPALDAVHMYTKLKHRTPGSSALAPLLARVGLVRRLRRERFDLAILARSGFDRHGLNFVRLLGIPRVIGFVPAAGAIPRGITDPLPVPDNARLHEVEAVWKLLDPLGIDATPGPLRVFPEPSQVAAWRGKVMRSGSPRDGTGATVVVAVHVSAREATRQLSAEKWIAFLHGLRAALPAATVALFWSPGAENDPRHPGDDAKAQRILDACGDLGVIPCPTKALDDLMAGLACCNTFVGADGGAMHAAVACRLPTVGLFENSPFKLAHWYPWQVRHELVASPTFAIGDIEPQSLVAATLRLLNGLRPS